MHITAYLLLGVKSCGFRIWLEWRWPDHKQTDPPLCVVVRKK